jgi:hypothetical protein
VAIDGGDVEAINFELHADEPAQAVAVLESVADGLGWELHSDDGDEDDDE